jgi:hypothetical protein
MPRHYWFMANQFGQKILIYFSVVELLKTLFAPWKRDAYVPINASLDIIVKAIWDNFISRLIGFLVRSITIFIGTVSALFGFLAIVVLLFVWLFVPVVIALILMKGF